MSQYPWAGPFAKDLERYLAPKPRIYKRWGGWWYTYHGIPTGPFPSVQQVAISMRAHG